MQLSSNPTDYLAPQSEVIVVRVERNFMGSDTKSFSSSFSFETSSVGEGEDLL